MTAARAVTDIVGIMGDYAATRADVFRCVPALRARLVREFASLYRTVCPEAVNRVLQLARLAGIL